MMDKQLQQFQKHIEAAGLIPETIVADGAFHRCPVKGKERDLDGVYKLHTDDPISGYFCNHTTGETGTWTASSKEKMSKADRDRLQERIKRDKAEAARQLEEERRETAQTAKQLYEIAEERVSHPYLAAKGVDIVPGLRVMGDMLLVPRMNLQGEIISMVRIWPDGEKKNAPGATWPGGFFPIKGADGPLLVCEGLSTGGSLHMATGWTVLCAFECGNLEAVSKGAREMYPEREIRLCADNDGKTKGNPGVTTATKAARLIGARLAVPKIPGKEKLDFNDLHTELGLQEVKKQVEGARPLEEDPEAVPEDNPGAWDRAEEMFPRGPFPWHRLPASVEKSLRQLARSGASSPLSLPGVALAIICGAVGNTVAVSPKSSWSEPLILYYADLRESGDGKTHPLWALAAPLIKRQEAENKRADKDLQEFDLLSKKEQKQARKPRPARGYFATGLTLEGLRQDLTGNPTGGTVVIMSELSSFISSQNQYKGGGDDREAWLCLHDGKPARVVRAGGKTAYISGARPQVVGGVQPEIFKRAFTSQDGTFLHDGTVFRLLVTHEPSTHFELTGESWTHENRQVWEKIIERALEWADGQIMEDDDNDNDF